MKNDHAAGASKSLKKTTKAIMNSWRTREFGRKAGYAIFYTTNNFSLGTPASEALMIYYDPSTQLLVSTKSAEKRRVNGFHTRA